MDAALEGECDLIHFVFFFLNQEALQTVHDLSQILNLHIEK